MTLPCPKNPWKRKKSGPWPWPRRPWPPTPRVVHVHPAEVEEATSQVHLRNSHGLDAARQGTVVSAGALAIATDGKGQEMGWEGDSTRFLADLDVARVGERAGKQAAAYLGAKPVPDGRYDLILENQVAAEFLGLLAASLLGDNLVKGRSMLAGQEGQLCASPMVSIVDDGLYPRGLGTAPFDGEGTPQGRTVLVEEGVLRGFVYDRLWGLAQPGKEHGQRGARLPQGPARGGLHKPALGPRASRLLMRWFRRWAGGLVISEIMGGHTADPVSGEFSFGAAGHLVEGGRIGRPVKSIAIAGQVLEVFKAVKAVGGDLRFFGRTGAPSLLVAGQSVSGP